MYGFRGLIILILSRLVLWYVESFPHFFPHWFECHKIGSLYVDLKLGPTTMDNCWLVCEYYKRSVRVPTCHLNKYSYLLRRNLSTLENNLYAAKIVSSAALKKMRYACLLAPCHETGHFPAADLVSFLIFWAWTKFLQNYTRKMLGKITGPDLIFGGYDRVFTNRLISSLKKILVKTVSQYLVAHPVWILIISLSSSLLPRVWAVKAP